MNLFGFGKKKATRPFNFLQFNGISPQEMNELSTYNSERSRGIVHTKEWDDKMAILQKQFDDHMADPEKQKIMWEMSWEA